MAKMADIHGGPLDGGKFQAPKKNSEIVDHFWFKHEETGTSFFYMWVGSHWRLDNQFTARELDEEYESWQ